MSYKLLIIDDDKQFVNSAKVALAKFNVDAAYSVDEAKNKLDDSVDLVLLDLVFDESRANVLQGMAFLPYLKSSYPDLPVVVMTGYSSTEKAVQAIKLGAEDFFNKKDMLWVDWIDKIRNYSKKYQKIRELEKRTDELESIVADTKILGVSKEIEYVRLKLRDIAQHSDDITVFLQGETGTGKNLAVRYFREYSKRKNKPYKELSIFELSPTILESELFGHAKGSFTGAFEAKVGLFEAADRGIIFLDEIGDYDLNIQSKIMRFIETKTISAVGSTKEKILDLQLILATNQDIKQLIKTGKFREDLYQRINQIKIELPPLRDRKKDIPILTEHFFNHFRIKEKTNLLKISPEVYDLLHDYHWPGNIRELQSVIWEACANARLHDDNIMKPEHIRKEIQNLKRPIMEPKRNIREVKLQLELQTIDNALRETMGQKEKAAQLIGSTADSMRYKIKDSIRRNPEFIRKFSYIARYYRKLFK
jgi:DNA-binding NtrC family response regulator